MDEPINRNVQCLTCGFLAKYDLHYQGPPPYIYEMPPRDRSSGEISWINLGPMHITGGFPRCYLSAANISEEIEFSAQSGMFRAEAARETFNRERQCQKWHQYTPGFSPQEHWEEIRMLELEQRRQEFEKKMADDQTAIMLKLDADQKEVIRLNDMRNRRFQWILAGIAVTEIIVGLLQILYPTGWPILQSLFGITPPVQSIPPMPPM